ncbi:uncharacterized protein LOC126828339 isoform X2 [Patella vulgata]|nr:uncharacterized protein LOC126828339 isoform X2 [Patella vulgata]XP_050413997.1 uncharacterized protein LOC126828339 isoform X2 [Patella vulgata]XP_050413998.1 uncharacterized protein LOC126828339 isoform X2 [Patella vulgata]XP_055958477.1 uncharacterized protein LOC126828339 isoform X2 [Patella vulgata]
MDPVANATLPVYGQWGVPGLSAFVGSIFSIWIILANIVVLMAIVASKCLRNARESLCIAHITVADLCMGLIFGPLTVDYFVKGYWDNGCDFLFNYTVIPFYVTFMTVHSLGLMNVFKLISDCCRAQIKKCLKVFLLVTVFALFWFYFIMVVVSTYNVRVTGISFSLKVGISCTDQFAIDKLGTIVLALMAYWAPMIFNIIFLIVLFIRVRKDLYSVERQLLTFKTHAVAVAVSCLLPLPAIAILGDLGSAVCFTHNCQVMATIANFYLLIKSGLMPCVWFISPEFRESIRHILSLVNIRSNT